MKRPAYRHVAADAPQARRLRPNVFSRAVRLALDGRLIVILGWVVLAAAGVTYGTLKISFDLRGDNLVAIDPRITAAERALETAFPGTAPIVAVVEATDPKAARAAAAGLA